MLGFHMCPWAQHVKCGAHLFSLCYLNLPSPEESPVPICSWWTGRVFHSPDQRWFRSRDLVHHRWAPQPLHNSASLRVCPQSIWSFCRLKLSNHTRLFLRLKECSLFYFCSSRGSLRYGCHQHCRNLTNLYSLCDPGLMHVWKPLFISYIFKLAGKLDKGQITPNELLPFEHRPTYLIPLSSSVIPFTMSYYVF